MRMRVYISGPITGMPDLNRHAFDEMERALRVAGYRPVNPHTLPSHSFAADVTWQGYMRRDIAALMTCSAIVMLPCWMDSGGAKLEHDLALAVGITEIFL